MYLNKSKKINCTDYKKLLLQENLILLIHQKHLSVTIWREMLIFYGPFIQETRIRHGRIFR